MDHNMSFVNVTEAKTHLTRLIRQVMAGEEIVITRAGEPIARLSPYQTDMRPRQGGQMRGKIWMADDFDAPDAETESLFFDGSLFPGDRAE
jgi:prevent-host-death family protein